MPHPGQEEDVAEQHGEEAHGVDERGHVGHGERAVPEQVEVEHRLGMAGAAHHEDRPAGRPRRHERPDDGRAPPSPRRPLGDAQHGERPGRRVTRRTPGVGGRRARPGPRLGEDPAPGQPGHEGHGQVHHEDPAPAAGRDEQGPNEGPVATARAPTPPHNATIWERRSSGKAASSRPSDDGSRAPPRPPAPGDRPPAGGPREPDRTARSQREDGQAGEEHPPAAQPVGGPAGRHQQGPEHDAVAGDDPGQLGAGVVGERAARWTGRRRSRSTGRARP